MTLAGTAKYPSYKYILAAIDWLIISTSLLISLNIREHSVSSGLALIGPPYRGDVVFFVAYGAFAVFVFQYFNLYKVNVFITLIDHSLQVMKALLCTAIGIAVVSFFTKGVWVVDSRLVIGYFTVIATGLSIVVRVICFRKLFQWFSTVDRFRRNVLIVGTGESGKSLAINLILHNYGGLRLVGFIGDDMPVGSVVFGGTKIVGTVSELQHAIIQHSVQEVVICLDNVDHVRLIEVVDVAARTNASVKVSSPLYSVIPSRVFIEQYGSIPVVGIAQMHPGPLKEKYKRIFDVVTTIVGLILLTPFFLLIGFLIKLDSQGPILFRQIRIGKNGKSFNFYKFRSMQLGSEADEARKHEALQFVKGLYRGGVGTTRTKIVNESRVTQVGRWLRKTSLDELPQLFNVLKGDMSLVGPRPCLPYEWDHYEEWHKKRLSVLPGCTGMWQVSGRSTVGFDDMVVLDLYYIQNSSLLLDLRLLVKTVPIILLGTGAK